MRLTRFFQCISVVFLSWGICLFIYAQKTFIVQPDFHHPTIWTGIVKKLTATPNTFSLHTPFSAIPSVQASALYENATSFIAIDTTSGQILAAKNADSPLSIASLTKIMTAVVALDLLTPQEDITISQASSLAPPTKIGVITGQHMTLDELLHAMLMTSANDAAQAVADGVDSTYGQHIFIQAMNEKAKFLGLSDTHFANPQGFDAIHNKSSAHDLAVLSQYALSHYPKLAEIVAKEYIQLPANREHKQFDLYNWNGLLGVYPGVMGVKIGNTDKAGYTTIIRAIREGHSILVVVLGAPGVLQRDLWTAQLLDDIFYTNFHIPKAQVTVKQLEEKYATWQYWN